MKPSNFKKKKLSGYLSDEFFFNINKNKKLKNTNILFLNLFKKFQMGFKISCVKVDKKYRKKLKKKYTFQLNYIPSNKKFRFFLKNLFLIINKIQDRKISTKILNTLNNLVFNFKQSELFRIKTLTLKSLSLKKQ